MAKKKAAEDEERLGLPPDPNNKLWWGKPLQRRLNCSRVTLYTFFKQGLGYMQVGGRRMVSERQILDFLEKQNGRK